MVTPGVARVGAGGGGREAAEESESSERSERVGWVSCYESQTSGRTLGPQFMVLNVLASLVQKVQILTQKALLERFWTDSRCSIFLLC